MTITNLDKRAFFEGDGVSTVFPFTFPLQVDTELLVIERTSGGVETKFLKNSDYTIVLTSGGDLGGTITTKVPVPSTSTLSLIGDTPATQNADLSAGKTTDPEVFEKGLDKSILVGRRSRDLAERSLHLSDGSTPSDKVFDAETTRITNVATPTASSDAATRGFVESLILAPGGPPDDILWFTPISPNRDGVTDDAALIQAAFNQTIAAGGGVVYFPQGNYAVSTTIFIGDGSDTSRSSWGNGIWVIFEGSGNEAQHFTPSIGTPSGVTFTRIGATTNAMFEIRGPVTGLQFTGSLTLDGGDTALEGFFARSLSHSRWDGQLIVTNLDSSDGTNAVKGIELNTVQFDASFFGGQEAGLSTSNCHFGGLISHLPDHENAQGIIFEGLRDPAGFGLEDCTFDFLHSYYHYRGAHGITYGVMRNSDIEEIRLTETAGGHEAALTGLFTPGGTIVGPAAHGFTDEYEPVRITTDGELPTGLGSLTEFRINVIDVNNYEFVPLGGGAAIVLGVTGDPDSAGYGPQTTVKDTGAGIFHDFITSDFPFPGPASIRVGLINFTLGSIKTSTAAALAVDQPTVIFERARITQPWWLPDVDLWGYMAIRYQMTDQGPWRAWGTGEHRRATVQADLVARGPLVTNALQTRTEIVEVTAATVIDAAILLPAPTAGDRVMVLNGTNAELTIWASPEPPGSGLRPVFYRGGRALKLQPNHHEIFHAVDTKQWYSAGFGLEVVSWEGETVFIGGQPFEI